MAYVERPELGLHIHIKDSCNWCCRKRMTKEDLDEQAQMVITKKGEAKLLDLKKVSRQRSGSEATAVKMAAMEASIANLQEVIQKIAEQAERDEETRQQRLSELQKRIDGVLQPAIETSPRKNEGVPSEITYGMVSQINEAIKYVFGNGSDMYE